MDSPLIAIPGLSASSLWDAGQKDGSFDLSHGMATPTMGSPLLEGLLPSSALSKQFTPQMMASSPLIPHVTGADMLAQSPLVTPRRTMMSPGGVPRMRTDTEVECTDAAREFVSSLPTPPGLARRPTPPSPADRSGKRSGLRPPSAAVATYAAAPMYIPASVKAHMLSKKDAVVVDGIDGRRFAKLYDVQDAEAVEALATVEAVTAAVEGVAGGGAADDTEVAKAEVAAEGMGEEGGVEDKEEGQQNTDKQADGEAIEREGDEAQNGDKGSNAEKAAGATAAGTTAAGTASRLKFAASRSNKRSGLAAPSRATPAPAAAKTTARRPKSKLAAPSAIPAPTSSALPIPAPSSSATLPSTSPAASNATGGEKENAPRAANVRSGIAPPSALVPPSKLPAKTRVARPKAKKKAVPVERTPVKEAAHMDFEESIAGKGGAVVNTPDLEARKKPRSAWSPIEKQRVTADEEYTMCTKKQRA